MGFSHSRQSHTTAYLLLFLLIASTALYYLFNNAYEVWSLTAYPILAILTYYFLTQPLYVAFLVIFTLYIYEKKKSTEAAIRGFIASVFIMVGLDLTGAPFAFPAILNVNGHFLLSSITNTGTAPYADFQIASLLAGPSGNVNFWIDLFVHAILPVILVMIGFLVARPKMFVQIVERA